MTAPITSNGPITTRLHHYAGRYSYGMYVNPNGKVYERTNTSNENEIFMFRYKYQNGYWRLSEHRSNKELREQGII